MLTDPTRTEKPASPSPTSVRFEPEEQKLVDAYADEWGCSKSDAVRQLVRGAADPDIRQRITAATFVRQAQLPPGHRYKVLRDFTCMIGITHVQLKASQVLSRDGHDPVFLEQLHQRGALLQPLP